MKKNKIDFRAITFDMNPIEKPLKIIQITDTHLSKDEVLTHSINTNLAYKKIINKMHADLMDADAVFLTGDLSEDESLESYQILADSLKKYDKKIFWIPGNHDSISQMQLAFDNQKNFYRTTKLSTSFWDFIF